MAKSNKLKIFFLLLSGIIIFIISTIVFYVLGLSKNMKDENLNKYIHFSDIGKEQLKEIEGEGNYWFGSADPKVTIVEFGDFACPLCKSSFGKIREISLTDKDVKIIYRDFPVVAEHSANLSLAARCAGEQGLFWVMHDKLFLNQGIKEESEIIEMAKQIGANTARFEVCYNNRKYWPQIQNDLEDGEKLNITGTPTLFFNGQRLEGDAPLSVLKQIITQLKSNYN